MSDTQDTQPQDPVNENVKDEVSKTYEVVDNQDGTQEIVDADFEEVAEEPMPPEEEKEKTNVETILNVDPNGIEHRYYKVTNGVYEGVTVTFSEIGFVKTSELDGAPEDTPEDDMTATGRILYEDTRSFSTDQLKQCPFFQDVVNSIFKHIIDKISQEAQAAQAAARAEAESAEEVPAQDTSNDAPQAGGEQTA